MAINSSTFVSDSILFVRDLIETNVTDPISSSRVGRERFVMTSYPQRDVKYPIITIKLRNASQIFRMGQQSEREWINIPFEVRIWARNIKEKENLLQEVWDVLRDNQYGASGTIEFGLHDFAPEGTGDVDESGEGAPKSKLFNIRYRAEI